MLFRLVVAIAVLFAGLPASGGVDAAIPPRVGTGVVATSGVSTRAVVDSSTAATLKPTIDERDVVIPAASAAATPGDVAAQADDGRIVTDEEGGTGRVESAVVETGAFQTIGLTWPAGESVAHLDAEVRTRAGGVWSGWQALAPADSEPDSGTAERAHARSGTDPVWVGEADAVQLSFADAAQGGPSGLKLALVSSPEVSTTQTAAASGPASFSNAVYSTSTAPTAVVTPQPTASPTTTPITTPPTAVTTPVPATSPATALAPTIITRAEWGAAPQACTPDVATRLVGAVVHHTADSNNYSTVAQAEQQIRNDQAYHINTLGWCDIGYNFLVDKWGNIYEGRANSMVEPVVGAHAAGFNTGTVGVAMLGNYSTLTPSTATQAAVAEVIAWRLAAYGVDPSGSMSYTTAGGSDKYAAGTTVTLQVISGHRDVYRTACPGDAGYAVLPTIRTLAAKGFAYAQRYVESQAVVKSLYQDVLGRGVDPGGLSTWTSALAGGMTVPQLATVLATSREYADETVVRDYQQVLGRAPDPGGMSTWTAALMNGAVRSEDLKVMLFSSPEFVAKSGGTAQSFVTALYRGGAGA
ncbi:N-acetylmuramoyl-L-alanine amidase [Cellulomonas sp. P24]|uniref:N-acetylmuramoyl-L-alanine amidase n=1 Tax=Cellulomonas sp. P24 TaxID=2885206 RepID=UPI00216AC0A5|nr:N-acetylmuramoyl-L-alanine amidase [Cellulomonas sp. P24]MCR6491778.1 N-acetylmuramoyl-L-alanine amidase [Cellulomonas sp. P24]